MKNTLITMALTIVSYCSYAQISTPSNGNVGVGIANPTYKFEVHGNDASSVAVFGNNSSTNGGLQGSLFIRSNSLTSIASLQSGGANSGLSFLTNSSGTDYVRMQITSTGNIGIGTTTPGSDLTIARSGTGVSISTAGSGYFGTFAFNRESATGTIFNPAANAFQINNGNGVDKNLHIQVYNGSGSGVNPDALTVNGTTGGVGINTSSMPAGYQFAVNGSAIATSMTVKLYGNWPDFVFKKNYLLPSLSDIKSYLDRHSHLPEMPSEQEIAEHGINLGEMNKILTKKVEELTLYLIKENQKNQDQQHKLEQQDARIAALEGALLKLSGK